METPSEAELVRRKKLAAEGSESDVEGDISVASQAIMKPGVNRPGKGTPDRRRKGPFGTGVDGPIPAAAGALYFALITMEEFWRDFYSSKWRRRKVRLPFAMALGLFIAMQVSLTPVANSAAFAGFAKWFARI